jgi:hypothetical protein
MSEQLNATKPEQHESLLSSPERQELLPEHAEKTAKEAKQEQAQQLVEARLQAHEQAGKDKVLEKLEAAEAAPAVAEPQQINRDLRQITLRRELQHIRRQLPASQRALSRVVHQPAVRIISEAAGKTISRPSGLLGGGLVALLGTTSYLYLAKHIGFTYNYFVFVALFIGGFIVGLVLELLVHVTTTSRRKIDS